MSKKLEGKVAVITGGNSGIGLATARRFVAEGAHVFITGRREAELDATVTQIGRNVTGVQGDVENLADLGRLFATVKRQQGRLDVLFANAGFLALAPLGSITEDHFDNLFDVNVKGVLFTVQKALPLFTNGGSIILTSSFASSEGPVFASVYSASKAAVRSFAGITTPVCLTSAATSAASDGYNVYALLDASGTRSDLLRLTAIDQMRQAGVTITSTEMLRDNASPLASEYYAALDLPATRYILQITQANNDASKRKAT
jgi:NAD(P)-dependent dehydrogenase (short-subunit alcohol dehydrogenase family)